MKNQGIQNVYIRLLAILYEESQAKIRTERERKYFELGRGLKQGDPLSPKQFTCLLENQFRKLEWKNKYDINIDGLRLTHQITSYC